MTDLAINKTYNIVIADKMGQHRARYLAATLELVADQKDIPVDITFAGTHVTANDSLVPLLAIMYNTKYAGIQMNFKDAPARTLSSGMIMDADLIVGVTPEERRDILSTPYMAEHPEFAGKITDIESLTGLEGGILDSGKVEPQVVPILLDLWGAIWNLLTTPKTETTGS